MNNIFAVGWTQRLESARRHRGKISYQVNPDIRPGRQPALFVARTNSGSPLNEIAFIVLSFAFTISSSGFLQCLYLFLGTVSGLHHFFPSTTAYGLCLFTESSSFAEAYAMPHLVVADVAQTGAEHRSVPIHTMHFRCQTQFQVPQGYGRSRRY